MEPTTQYILIGILIVVLFGILGWMFVVIYGGGGGGPAGPGDQCWPGTTYYQGYGCFSCDPTSSTCQGCEPGHNNECQNGGTCVAITETASACGCVAPYFGPQCTQVCSTTAPCLNGGTCTSTGTCNCPAGYGGPTCAIKTAGCTATNCTSPGCDIKTCPTCNDGFATDPNDPSGKLCGTCAPGRGPGYPNCKLKLYTGQYQLASGPPHHDCFATSDPTTLNSECYQIFGEGATWSNNKCSGTNDGCGGVTNPIICNVPKFWANPNYLNFDPCPQNAPYGYDQWLAQGGQPYFGQNSQAEAHSPPIGRQITTNHKYA